MVKYFRGATVTYTTQIITLVLSFVINIVIVRMLGAEGKGAISLLQHYFLILAAFFMFGMSEGNIYYLGNQKYNHRVVFSNVVVHTILLTLLFVSLSLILANWILSSFLKNIDFEHYRTALWIFPAFILFLHTTTMLLGHKNIIGFNIVTVARFLCILLFLLLLSPLLGIQGALIATVIGFFVADGIGIVLLMRYGRPVWSISTHFFKDAFVFGAKSQLGLMLSRIDRRLDIFIINMYLNPAHVGFYAIAVAVAELPWHISHALATVLFPEVSGMKKQDAFEFTSLICRNSLFIVFLLGLSLFFLGGPIIIFLFGPQFEKSTVPMRILVLGVIALSINKILCAAFSGTGKPEYGTYTTLFSSITTVGLDFLLIPVWGITGAAIASAIAYSVSALTGIVLFSRTSHYTPGRFLLVKPRELKQYPVLIRKTIFGLGK